MLVYAQHNQYSFKCQYGYFDYRGKRNVIFYKVEGSDKWERVKANDYFSIKTDSGNWLALTYNRLTDKIHNG